MSYILFGAVLPQLVNRGRMLTVGAVMAAVAVATWSSLRRFVGVPDHRRVLKNRNGTEMVADLQRYIRGRGFAFSLLGSGLPRRLETS